MAPAAGSVLVERLANLSPAGGAHRAFGQVEIEAGGLPIDAEIFDQTAGFLFGGGEQRLVG